MRNRKAWLFFVVVLLAMDGWSQLAKVFGESGKKQIISTEVFGKWTDVNGGAISNDGKFVIYYIYNDPVGTSNIRYVIKSADSKWRKEFPGALSAGFSPDGKWAIVQKNGDSLEIFSPGAEKVKYLTGIKSYQVVGNKEGQWILATSASAPLNVILYNIGRGTNVTFQSVLEFKLADNGEKIVFKRIDEGNKGRLLELWTFKDGQSHVIWRGNNALNFSFNKEGGRLAFITERQSEVGGRFELWHHKEGMRSANVLNVISQQLLSNDSNIIFSNCRPEFAMDDSSIIVNLVCSEKGASRQERQPDIWRYNEDVLNINNPRQKQRYSYSILIKPNGIAVLLTQKNETLLEMSKGYALVLKRLNNEALFESYWNDAARDTYYLVNMEDGSRKHIDVDLKEGPNMGLSPHGKWLIYYDSKNRSFCSYEVSTGIIRNITKGIHTQWIEAEGEMPEIKLTWASSQKTWIDDDKAVIIYDEFDMWQIDPRGIKEPVNLTKGVGEKNKIKFRMLEEGAQLCSLKVSEKPSIVLIAFNKQSKENGFYRINLGSGREPQLLNIGPYLYYWPEINYIDIPLKAKYANVRLVKRMSSREAPNYFLTRDFKRFAPISDVQPQKAFNWMTVELLLWKNRDSSESTGLLYKPENFNPSRRYPVIFHFYEKRSDELNLFMNPQPSEGGINIPYFVSNGYLVYVPDIHYAIGSPGESAFNAVINAAHYLGQFPFVDSNRMGLQGHSFGGYETYSIITRTNVFACAVSTAGISNLVSFFGSAAREGYPMYWSERNQGRLGIPFWQDPDKYVKNSPVFFADKIMTPLLIVHNKSDNVVPFSQGLEMFTALRRLQRKAWLVQYDNSKHIIERQDGNDYTLRMKEFFDHFLYGQPMPQWMQ